MTRSRSPATGRPSRSKPTDGASPTADRSYRAFVDRFGLAIDLADCQGWFVNWARNHLLGSRTFHSASEDVAFGLASHVGLPYKPLSLADRLMKESGDTTPSFADYLPGSFIGTLNALEFLHSAIPDARAQIDVIATEGLRNAPCDLQIRWGDGEFRPAGAPILDEGLVIPALDYLRRAGLAGAAMPLERSLRALLDGSGNESRYKDCIRDAYEAVEYTAKIVTGRDTDLSANRERFAKRAGLASTTTALLAAYILFGNQYRHADSLEGLPAVDRDRAELFVYETALILRAAESAAVKAAEGTARSETEPR